MIYSHIMYKDFVKFIFAGITESRAIEIDNYYRTAKYVLYITSQYQTRLKKGNETLSLLVNIKKFKERKEHLEGTRWHTLPIVCNLHCR